MLSYAFCLLLLGVLANCDDNPPHYLQAQIDVNDVLDILKEQVLSMDHDIPLLNDTRRHYAEFVYVIFELADAHSGCFGHDYHQEYMRDINEFIPAALNKPQAVVDQVRANIEDFLRDTTVIRDAIRKTCFPDGYGSYYSNSHRCDLKVQRIVNSIGFPRQQAKILLAAGKAANSFLEKHDVFLAVSKAHNTKWYIVYGADQLEQVVMNVADYLRALRGRNQLLGVNEC